MLSQIGNCRVGDQASGPCPCESGAGLQYRGRVLDDRNRVVLIPRRSGRGLPRAIAPPARDLDGHDSSIAISAPGRISLSGASVNTRPVAMLGPTRGGGQLHVSNSAAIMRGVEKGCSLSSWDKQRAKGRRPR